MATKLRVLCLHGKQQTASVFRDKLHKMIRHCGGVATFEFLEAPYELPRGPGDDLSMRSWATPGSGDYAEAIRLLAQRLEGPSMSFADGSGVDGAAPTNAAAADDGGVDVLFGFSQGCLVILTYLMAKLQHCPSSSSLPVRPLRGVILAGCPTPVGGLAGAAAAAVSGIPLPSLHFVGARDDITPPNASRAVAEALFSADCSCSIAEHPHAHSIPQNVDLCTTLVSWLEGVAAAAHTKGVHNRRSDNDVSAVVVGGEASKQRQAEVLSDINDEVEMVQAIMGDGTVDVLLAGDDARLLCSARGLCAVRVRLALGDDNASPAAVVRLVIPTTYPTTLPDIVLDKLPTVLADRRRWQADFVVDMMRDASAASLCGTAMLLPLVMMLQEKLQEALGSSVDDDDGSRRDLQGSSGGREDPWRAQENDDIAARTVWIRKAQIEADQRLAYAAASGAVCGANGGGWELTVGLIGKPSAGKSTFFNAATDPECEAKAAKVAAFPFTTIEPNVGHGFYPSPCPCAFLGLNPSACGAEYGHVNLVMPADGDAKMAASRSQQQHRSVQLHRRLPVTIKDVAGLVQGAYQGKGNQFLNDLCDADVLVHVVDGAAATDAEGATCNPGEGSALEDVMWVKDELHNWIFDNVSAKWTHIARRPERFGGMFSGYQAPRALVDHALMLCGIKNAKEAAVKIPTWMPTDLHCFVACFVALRFPIVVALNKADVPSFARMAKQLHERYPHECFVSMSAKLECDLLEMRKRGVIAYQPGEATASIVRTNGCREVAAKETTTNLTSATADDKTQEGNLQRKLQFLADHDGTGVQHVLRAAIARCQPLLLYPADDIRAYAAALNGSGGNSSSSSCNGLATCLVMKHGSTAEDAFRSYMRRLLAHRHGGGGATVSAAPSATSAVSAPTQQQRDASAQYKLVRFEWMEVAAPSGVQDDAATVDPHPLRSKQVLDAPRPSTTVTVVVCRKDDILAQVPHALIRVMTNARSH